jgi:hypothetical protein
MKTQTSKTPMIKSAAWNKIQQYFRSYKKWDKTKREYVEQNPLFLLSDKVKMEIVSKAMVESINELNSYRAQRKAAKVVHEGRVKNGYYEKKAVKKAKHKELSRERVKA